MPETSDAAVADGRSSSPKKKRVAMRRPRPKPASCSPTICCPASAATPMPLRDGLRIGGMAMIISLLLVNVIETFDQVALQVLAPDIQQTLDVSKTTLQGLTSLGGVVLVVATLPFAWLADRYMRTRILAAATFVWSVFMMLTGAVGGAVADGLRRAGRRASARRRASRSRHH